MATATAEGLRMVADRGALREVLNVLAKVAPKNNPKPVLTHVMIEAQEDRAVLRATDLEVYARVQLAQVEVNAEGSVCVPAELLRSVLDRMSEPTVKIHVEGRKLKVVGEGDVFTLYTMDAGEMPPHPDEADGAEVVSVTAGGLRSALNRVSAAMANQNTRYACAGVYVEMNSGTLRTVATDGHRLALDEVDAQGGKPNGIIAHHAIGLILQLLKAGDAEDQVRLATGTNTAHVKVGDWHLASAMVEGNFPPYKDVIPKDTDRKAELALDTAIGRMRAAAIMTSDESKGLRLTFGDDGLTITSQTPDVGEAELHMELASYEGEPIEIGFNPAYLLDALKVVDESTACFHMTAPNKPGLITSGAYKHVVMPLQLQ